MIDTVAVPRPVTETGTFGLDGGPEVGSRPTEQCRSAAEPASRQADVARKANAVHYADPETTLQYIDDRYHAVRRQQAMRLLVEALCGPVPAPGGPVLEVGTGARSMLDDLPAGWLAIDADLSWGALRMHHRRRHPAACFDATRPFPFIDGSMAAVLMGELVEHVYYPEEMLREVHRVLRPGGILVLTTPNLATLPDRLCFLFGSAPRQVDPLHPHLSLHIRPFTVGSLRRLLDVVGFDLIAVRSNFVGVHLGSGRWLQSRTLAKLFPGLGGSLVVSARRRRPPAATTSG